MWRPRSWSELEALIGTVEESAGLEFKRALTGDNAEVAKDIAAMTVNGGVLLYGVAQDRETGLARELHPMAFRGVEERLHQIAGSRIAPIPDFRVETLSAAAGGTDGVVLVVVPPSPLAPHQVDGRYPSRRGTTTGDLGEVEVERLYRQRGDLSGPLPSATELVGEVAYAPAGEPGPTLRHADVGYLTLLVRPVARELAHPAGAWQKPHLTAAVYNAVQRQQPRLANISLARMFNALSDWRAFGATGWTAGELQGGDSGYYYCPHVRFGAALTYPAQLSFQARWWLNVTDGSTQVLYRSARELEVGREVISMLAVAGEYFSDLDGAGLLVVALELSGFEGAKSAHSTRGRRQAEFTHLPGAPEGLSGAVQVGALEIRDEPERCARLLLERWLPPFYVDSPDFFEVLVPGAVAQ